MTQAPPAGVRVTKVRTALSKQMGRPGGRTAQEAVARADAALETHRDDAMAALARTLAELEALCAARSPDARAAVYGHATTLVGLAGFFDTGPLYTAAYSLCEVSDRMDPSAWDWAAIDVHLRTLRLILAEGCRESEATAVLLAGLKSVRERVTR